MTLSSYLLVLPNGSIPHTQDRKRYKVYKTKQYAELKAVGLKLKAIKVKIVF